MVSMEKPKMLLRKILYFLVVLVILALIIVLVIVGSVVWLVLLGIGIVSWIIFSIVRFFRRKLGKKEKVETRKHSYTDEEKKVQVLDAEVVSSEEEK